MDVTANEAVPATAIYPGFNTSWTIIKNLTQRRSYCVNANSYKIRNPYYAHWIGREKLFERESSTDPTALLNVWASASDQLVQAPPPSWNPSAKWKKKPAQRK